MLSKGTSVGSKAARARRQAASGLKAASAAETSAQAVHQQAEGRQEAAGVDLDSMFHPFERCHAQHAYHLRQFDSGGRVAVDDGHLEGVGIYASLML